MNIDWKLLIQLRERHKLAAQEAVARERRAAQQQEARVRDAHDALADRVDAKARLWQQANASALDMGALRQTAAWSRALDAQIANAGRSLGQAQQAAQQQYERLDHSRDELRGACGELNKAEQMHARALAAQRRRAELRAEDGAEEHAVQRWEARSETTWGQR